MAGRSAPIFLVALFAALLCALFIDAPVRAHGGGAGLEILPSRVAAGDTVRLVGDDFEGGDRVRLTLLAGDGDVVLGEVVTDADGHFTTEILLPAGLELRPYEIRATDSFGDAVSGFITVDQAGAPGSGPSASVVPGLLTAVAAVAAALASLWLLRRRRIGHLVHGTEDEQRLPS